MAKNRSGGIYSKGYVKRVAEYEFFRTIFYNIKKKSTDPAIIAWCEALNSIITKKEGALCDFDNYTLDVVRGNAKIYTKEELEKFKVEVENYGKEKKHDTPERDKTSQQRSYRFDGKKFRW